MTATYVQQLVSEFMLHPFAYTMGTLTVIGALLKKFAPNLRVTRALNALSTDAPELATIAASFMSKTSLLKALELGGHVISDVAKAVETPETPVVEDKKEVTAPDVDELQKIKATLEQLLASLSQDGKTK
jgi:hypothetical protein